MNIAQAAEFGKARRRLEWAAAGCLFLVPLAINPWGLAPGGEVKDAAMWLAVAVLAWLLATWVRARGGVPPQPRRLVVPAFVWLGTVAVSLYAAESRAASAWAALQIIPVAVMALIFAVLSRRAPARSLFMRAWALGAGLAALFAVAQHYGLPPASWLDPRPYGRVSGTLGQPTFTAAYLAAALPFALATLWNRRTAWLGAASVVAILLALNATYSRAGWVAGVAGAAVFLCMLRFGPPHRRRMVLAPLLLGGLLCAAMTTSDLYRADRRQFDRFERMQEGDDKSVTERALFIRIMGEAVRQRPLLGWGPDGFRSAAAVLDRDRTSRPFALAWPHPNAHNEFFTAALDGGLLGLLAWGAVILTLASTVSDAARRETGARKVQMAAVYGSVVAFVVQGMATPRPPVTTLGLALCWGLAAGMTGPRGAARKRRQAAALPRAAVYAGRVGAVACLFLGVCLVAADVVGYRGIRAQRDGRLMAAERDFRAASRLYPMELDYRRLWGEAAFARAGDAAGAARVEAARSAAAAFGANLAVEPRNGFWHAGLARALSFYDLPAARGEVETAKALYPQSGHIRYVDSVVCRAEGRPAAEKAALHAATENGTTEPEPYIRLAEIFRAEGRPDLSRTLLTFAADNWTNRDDLAPWRSKHQAKAGR